MVNHETNDTSIRPFQFYCHLLILQLMNGSLIKEIINQKKQNLLYIIIFIIKNRINVLFFCFFKERNLFILIINYYWRDLCEIWLLERSNYT